MLIFVIAVGVVVLSVVLGLLIAFGASGLDKAVKDSQMALENKDKGYNLAFTMGHRVKVEADLGTQLKEARRLAAEIAASMPRGANMAIGRLGQQSLRTASQGLQDDPITAVKIAAFHGWDGARSGITAAAPVAAPAAVAAPAPAAEVELVPGKDYPVIEVTDDMTPEEKRKARIANAKAKSAAAKAAKAQQEAADVPEAVAAPAPAAIPSAAAAGLPEPPELIEITDDMSPDEKRKALIANSKAKSAYNKALKAAGADPSAVVQGAAQAVAAQPAVSEAAAAPAAVTLPAGLPAPPELIEITDDMSPDEKRRALIANSKAKSAYNKALKAAGIDPKSVDG